MTTFTDRLHLCNWHDLFSPVTFSIALFTFTCLLSIGNPDDQVLALESESVNTAPSPNPKKIIIGRQGGKLKSSEVSVIVPPDAVSTDASFSLETYIDRRMMPPVDVHRQEVVLSPAVCISSQHIGVFNKHIQLSLLPEVDLKSSGPVNGWMLELKSSDLSSNGKWRTELKLNTNTGSSISQSSVKYDFRSSTIQLCHLHLGKWYAWTGKPLSKRCRRGIRYMVFGKRSELHKHKVKLQALIIHWPRNVTYEEVKRNLGTQNYVNLAEKSDEIQEHDILTLKLKTLGKWQVYSGKSEAEIHTNRIWHRKLDETMYCFHNLVLEDQSGSSSDLRFTIDVSFESKKDLKPTEIRIRHDMFLFPSVSPSGTPQGTVIPYDNCSASFCRRRRGPSWTWKNLSIKDLKKQHKSKVHQMLLRF